MDDDVDKNGGPNHLRAWMRFRGVNGAQLATALGGNVTPGMVSDLVNSKRQLSAKWLRRLAPILHTTPGHLLDHDPTDLPTDIAEVWFAADPDQKKKIIELAKVIVPSTGTHG
ncbi:helix-turn-helix domain-containing protein [Sphingomonas phyllosphaerae]|uniref:helix-turn-helix domain-containing protein n=1 Tax=Sphingomonas phyllosphaerae TaxID=257003 RepID=UPI002FF5BE2B